MDSQRLSELRRRHPALVYRSYAIHRADNDVSFTAELLLEPNIVFRPTVTIRLDREIETTQLETFAFHLGLIESISYWKCACPPQLRVEAGSLSQKQIVWWKDLFLHGLGECFYRNAIDFSGDDFLDIVAAQTPSVALHNRQNYSGDLILAAGGKDSALALELLRERNPADTVFTLNPTRSAIESAELAGFKQIVTAKRAIDPTLIDLNAKGYINGHTPFSAYLAFLGTAVAEMCGLEHVVVSNEWSANEGNATAYGMEINHQYSKSVRFEEMFRAYAKEYLTPNVEYFSFLRPLSEIQVSALFSQYKEQIKSFRSCNVNQRSDSWCGECPKCAFVFLTMTPFAGIDTMIELFGGNILERPRIVQEIEALLGSANHKPFECVGTVEESRAAFALLLREVEKHSALNREGFDAFLALANRQRHFLPADDRIRSLLATWQDHNNLPAKHLSVLRDALSALEVNS